MRGIGEVSDKLPPLCIHAGVRMKRALIITLVWLAPFSSYAEPDFGIALKGGANAATLARENRFSTYGVTGGLAGNLQWPFDDRFSVGAQTELLYTPRGAEARADGEYLGIVRENYLDLIIAARPEARFGRFSVYLLLGAGVDFLLNAEQENASGAKQDITESLRRIDVALLAGAGFALHLPQSELGRFRLDTIFLEARHDHGLIDGDEVNGGFKNRTSSLMLGLSLAIGPRSSSPRPSPVSDPGAPPAPTPVTGADAAE